MLALAIHPCDVAFGLLSINAEVYYAVVQRGKKTFSLICSLVVLLSSLQRLLEEKKLTSSNSIYS